MFWSHFIYVAKLVPSLMFSVDNYSSSLNFSDSNSGVWNRTQADKWAKYMIVAEDFCEPLMRFSASASIFLTPYRQYQSNRSDFITENEAGTIHSHADNSLSSRHTLNSATRTEYISYFHNYEIHHHFRNSRKALFYTYALFRAMPRLEAVASFFRIRHFRCQHSELI